MYSLSHCINDNSLIISRLLWIQYPIIRKVQWCHLIFIDLYGVYCCSLQNQVMLKAGYISQQIIFPWELAWKFLLVWSPTFFALPSKLNFVTSSLSCSCPNRDSEELCNNVLLGSLHTSLDWNHVEPACHLQERFAMH